MYTYTKNTVITLKATASTGGNATISNYEWSLNNSLLQYDTDIFTMNTNDMNVGDNTLALRVKNSCGNYSDTISKTVKIIETVTTDIPVPKLIDIVVNEPEITKTIVIDMLAKVTINVVDSLNKPIPNVSVSIDNINGITNTNGQVVLNNVPYGNKQIKIYTV